MSCFIMKPESTAKIAVYVYSLFQPGEVYDLPGEWRTAVYQAATENGEKFSEKSIYNALMRLNISAYNQRYKEIGEDFADFPRNVPTAFTLKSKLPELVKLIECYLYQCCEGRTPETALYKAIEELQNETYRRIVHKLPEYDVANWG